MTLHLISYLAPSLPEAFFTFVAERIGGACAVDVNLRFDQSISGPLPGDENPFASRSADIGFVCAPTYRWLRDELELLPLPVPTDVRALGRPVYFADVVVRADSPVRSFTELRSARWAFNDRNSRSGWFSMVERVEPLGGIGFFGDLIHAGSHLKSLASILDGSADAAAIDSNALLIAQRSDPALPAKIRLLESWGPFPIQPIVMRSELSASIKRTARETLLTLHHKEATRLAEFGFERFVEGRDEDYR